MIVIAGVLLIQGSEYVLQHRDDIPTIATPGTYSLWGGRLEGKESPKEAALRELREETGVVLDRNDLMPLSNFDSVGEGPDSFGKPVHVYLFAAKVAQDAVVDFKEGQGIIRLPRYSELHEKLNEFAKEAIEVYEAAAR